MSVSKLGARYAKSLIDLSVETNQLDKVKKDMELISETCNQSSELKTALKSPVIKGDKKQQILKAVFGDNISELSHKFIDLLVKKGRDQYLIEIADAFVSQYRKYNNITQVKMTSAVELPEDMINGFESKIQEVFKLEKTEIEHLVNPDLIGGFVIRFEDKLYDTSISGKLDALKKSFKDKSFVKQI